MKRVLVVVGIFAGLLLVVAVTLPFLVSANTFLPSLEQELSATLGRTVTIGNLSLNLFQGGLKADNLAIGDDPAFSKQPFLQAKQLGIGVDLPLLLLHKRLDVKKLEIVDPQIQLLQAANGKWNYSSLGGNKGRSSSQGGASSSAVNSIDSVQIKNGVAKVQVTGATAARVYSGIDLTISHFSLTTEFPFQLTANLPSDGTVKLMGVAGPIDNQDSSLTPFRADLTMRHIDPVGAGFLEAQAGISGLLDVDAKMASNAVTMTSTGEVTGTHMRFSAQGAPATVPMKVQYTTSYNLASAIGNISRTSLTAGSVVANLSGTYQLLPGHPQVQLQVDGRSLSIDALQGLLPAFGVKLPNGSVLRGGTLSTQMAIDGPMNALTITGPVDIGNTQLAGFNLGSKLAAVSALNKLAGGTGNVTAIQTLQANLKDTPQAIAVTNILAVLPALGQATGSGTILPGGQLNFNMLAKLTGNAGLGAVATDVMAALPGLLGQRVKSDGIPITVRGTTSDPKFNVDAGVFTSGGAANSQTKGQANPVGNILHGLFGAH